MKRSGRRKVFGGGSGGVFRRGSGLGTGPVGNGGGFAGRFGSSAGGRSSQQQSRNSGTRGMGGQSYGPLFGGLFGSGAGGAYGSGGAYGNGGGLGNGFDQGNRNGSNGKRGCLSTIITLFLIFLLVSWLFNFCSSTGENQEIVQGYEDYYQPQDQNMWGNQTLPYTDGTGTAASEGSSTGNTLLLSNQNGVLDTTVRSGSRVKYTDVEHARKTTVLVYICGSNLESESGMATSDLQEMIKAGLTENDPVNLIVYTGGASRWQNNVISRRTNQIYRVVGDGLERLVEDDGDKAMTEPETLASFITYGATNYPADRYMLILWDHGAGSVVGYGYDENHTSRGYMNLAKIQDALQKAGVRFDFIGYDACLMATVSNALMLSEFADYMVASEETEPGTGWYYTGWLKALKQQPSIPTVELGKIIADDYTQASSSYQAGATTTLSVTDLAELQTFLGDSLRDFSVGTLSLLNSDSYKTVSDARSNTKEFAATEGLDQADMVHFALNMGTEEGNEFAKTLDSAVKYNRTSYGYDTAYGLSEYFPWHSKSNVDEAIENYDELGMEDSYTATIRTFANMQMSGQIASGGSSGSYGSLFDSLFGGYGYDYSGYGGYPGYGTYRPNEDYNGFNGGYGSADYFNGNAYNQSGTIDLASMAQLISMFSSRSTISGVREGTNRFVDTKQMTDFSSYVAANSINPNHLNWKTTSEGKRLAFDEKDWNATSRVLYSAFYDDGSGFIDLGLDNVYSFDQNGQLIGESDGTWLSMNGQIVAYYFLDENAEGEEYQVRGYIPALINEKQSEIYVVFNEENLSGKITGYRNVYSGDQQGKGDKVLAFADGDIIEPIADYYHYPNSETGCVEYDDTFRIGDAITYRGSLELRNIKVDGKLNESYQITDIYGQRFWTANINR